MGIIIIHDWRVLISITYFYLLVVKAIIHLL